MFEPDFGYSFSGITTSSSVSGNAITGKNVYIEGEFIVNTVGFTIANCVLKMAPGALIRVRFPWLE